MNGYVEAIAILQNKGNQSKPGQVKQFSCQIAECVVANLVLSKGYRSKGFGPLLVAQLDLSHPLPYELLVDFNDFRVEK